MQHTRTKTITVTETYATCDRCSREMHPNNHDCEHQERLAVRFRAGYGSVFGDGSLVELDLCQHCTQEVLGQWMRITPDDPFDPAHPSAGRGDPKGAYQQYQLEPAAEADELREAMRRLLRDRPAAD